MLVNRRNDEWSTRDRMIFEEELQQPEDKMDPKVGLVV
jgi:hypothetical protein